MNALGKILGLIDGNIDLGAITGIFGRVATLVQRVPELIARARTLAQKFRADPELKAFFDDVQDLVGDIPGLLRLENGQEISAADIQALRKHGADLYGRRGNDPTIDPPPPPPPPDPKPTEFDYGVILDADPDDSLLVNKDEIFSTLIDGVKKFMAWGRVGAKPNLNAPPPGGWELHRRVSK